jgi:hypothetical protein
MLQVKRLCSGVHCYMLEVLSLGMGSIEWTLKCLAMMTNGQVARGDITDEWD